MNCWVRMGVWRVLVSSDERQASYYVELLHEGSNEPAPGDEVGWIVATDLYKGRFP